MAGGGGGAAAVVGDGATGWAGTSVVGGSSVGGLAAGGEGSDFGAGFCRPSGMISTLSSESLSREISTSDVSSFS